VEIDSWLTGGVQISGAALESWFALPGVPYPGELDCLAPWSVCCSISHSVILVMAARAASCALPVTCWCAGRCTHRMPGRGEGRRSQASLQLQCPLRMGPGEGRALGSWLSKSERCWMPGAARA